MKVDNKKQSNKKYVYKLSYNIDNGASIEQYPIIYENEDFLYFKTSRKGALGYDRKCNMYENINSLLESKTPIVDRFWYSIYLYNCDENIKDIYYDFLNK